MSTTEPTIALDMDGVLVESNWDNMERLNEKFGTSYRLEDIKSFSYDFLTKEQRTFIYEECWHDPTLYDDAVLSQCQTIAISKLRDIGRVIVVTSPLLGHIESKFRFLTNHFPRPDIVLASDKTLIDADVLIDDGIHNLEVFPGIPICFHRPWNEEWDGPRVYDFQFIPNAVRHVLKHEGDHSE